MEDYSSHYYDKIFISLWYIFILFFMFARNFFRFPGGGCTKASIACGNLTPYLCYGALSRGFRKKFSKCTKQNFPCVRSPSGDTVPRAVDQSEASLQTKIRCCMSTKTIACGEAWRNHPKRNVVPILQLDALIAAVMSRKEVLFSSIL